MEHRVLLRLVEAMDLVDEEDRPQAVRAEALSRAGDDSAHVVDTRGNSGDLLERGAGALGDDPRDRGLPRPGRPEEDHRRRAVLLDRDPERRSRPEHVALPDELVERVEAGGALRVARSPLAGRAPPP